MAPGPIIGLFGDVFTFAGGVLLAQDALQKEKEFDKIKRVSAALNSPFMAQLHVEVGGVRIWDTKEDVERAFVHLSARKAVWGFRILSGGFLLLIVTRTLEVISGR